MSTSSNIPDDYDFEAATESERWAYDQGYEAGHQAALDPATMDVPEIHAALRVLIAALERIVGDEQ